MKNSLKFVLAAATGLASVQSMAAGFEKNTMWSGRYMGRAGAAVSSVDGSEALYFNPARMINAQAPQSVSFALSPTMSYYKAPIQMNPSSGPASESEVIKSENSTSLPGALLYNYKLNEDLALGAGLYVAGGSDVEYKNVTVDAGSAYKGSVKTDLKIYELSLGGAYKVNEMLSVGLAWRVSMVDAAFNMLKRVDGSVNSALTGGALTTDTSVQTNFSGMKATSYSGVRLGINFTPSEAWGIGLSYRSNVDFEAKGKSTQTSYALTGAVAGSPRTDDNARLESSLPQQLNIGGHYKISEAWTGFAEYSWTEYSKVKSLDVTAVGVSNRAIPDVEAKWKDQSVVRLAAEYTGMIVPIRFGYSYTSQVTPNSTATPALATPGVAHTVAVGTTYEMSESLRFDGALEYTQVNGKVKTSDQSNKGLGSSEPAAGNYSSAAVPAVHLGATYFF